MTIALTSIRKPQRRQKLLRRIRLLDLIHQNSYRKLIFLCAPAGFGKTTLLIDYAEDTELSVSWYQIKYSDNNLTAFFQHFLASIRESQPDFGVSLEKILFQGSNISPRILATELVNELTIEIQDYTLLIMDDYHHVCEDLEIVTFIEFLLEDLPEHIRIIIGSRSVYGIPTASLFVNEELAIISIDDLRFRPQEVQDLARQHYKIRLSDDQCEEIVQKSDGWIIAVLLSLRDGTRKTSFPKITDARERIFNFFAKEVFFQLNGTIKNFLIVTSVSDEFNSDVSNFVLDIKDADKIIKLIEDQNLFISSTQTRKGEYHQYHQLFKEFLETKFQELSEDRKVDIHRKYSIWYETQNDVLNAIHHLQLSGDRDNMARVMDHNAKSMYISGQEATLEHWFKQLIQPVDISNKSPDVILNIVKSRISQGKLDGVIDLLDKAEPVFIQRQDHEDYANLLVMRGMALVFMGEYEEAIQFANQAEKYVVSQNVERHYAYQALRVKGLGIFYQGSIKNSLPILDEALRGFKSLFEFDPSDRIKHEIIMILADIGFIALKMGDIFKAQSSYQEAFELSFNMRGNRGDLATSANNYAYLSFLMGDYQKAWQFYEQALAAAEEVGWDRVIISILNSQAELLINIDEFEMAGNALQEATKLLAKKPLGKNSSYTYQLMADLETIKGDFNQAMFFLREAASKNQADINDPEYQLKMAEIYLVMEQPALVISTLKKTLEKLNNDTNPNQNLAKAFFLLSIAYYLNEDVQNAQENLSQSFVDAARLGYDSFLLSLAHRHPKMIVDINKESDNKLLDVFAKRLRDYQTGYQNLIQKETVVEKPIRLAFQVTAFGDGEIRRNSEIIPSASWRSAGARALFFFILDKGKVKRDDIIIQFWPEFSNAKVNSNFHATLWRVRHALGSKQIISFENDFYYINPRVDLFYDVMEFEELLEKFNSPGISINNQREISLQLLDLYKGEFLHDVDMNWSNIRRLQIKENFNNFLEKYAEIELKRGSFSEARMLFEKAIIYNPYQDYLHMGLMNCLIKLNSLAKAKTHFISYRKKLQEDLNLEPVIELVDLFDSIK